MVKKHVLAVDYKPIGDNKFRESSCLIQASSTIPIESAEFPGFLTDTFKEKFKSCCKFALSSKNQLLALITPDRELELYGLKESSAVPKCRLRGLYLHND
uniref:Uncharacterized protein n=1 Tax=Panagrolaimus davidi TaxID=227884 RepID=A0A914P3C8_9BILA